jgi:hypothetical protein
MQDWQKLTNLRKHVMVEPPWAIQATFEFWHSLGSKERFQWGTSAVEVRLAHHLKIPERFVLNVVLQPPNGHPNRKNDDRDPMDGMYGAFLLHSTFFDLKRSHFRWYMSKSKS